MRKPAPHACPVCGRVKHTAKCASLIAVFEREERRAEEAKRPK